MSFEGVDIERIVAEVMGRLLTSSPPLRSDDRPAAQASSVSASSEVETSNATSIPGMVITAELVQEGLNGSRNFSGGIRIGPRAILTPSARDYLRTKNIAWTRETIAVTAGGSKTRWLAVISKANSQAEGVVKNLQAGGLAWEQRLVGLPVEAVSHATSAICRGEAAGVVVFSGEPEVVACLANRNQSVRAAVAANSHSAVAAKQSLGANLLAIDPAGKNFFELRTTLNAFTASGAPKPPANWER